MMNFSRAIEVLKCRFTVKAWGSAVVLILKYSRDFKELNGPDMTPPPNKDLLALVCNSAFSLEAASSLSTALELPLLQDIDPKHHNDSEFVLLFDEHGLALQQTGRKVPGEIRVDFTSGGVDHRRKQGGGKGQMIAKACGLKAGVYPKILDMTAGLGKDAFVLASLGCELLLNERSPVVYALLSDGLARGKSFGRFDDPDLAEILDRIQLLGNGDSRLLNLPADSVDVVYLDPMFPSRDKSADVKKEMRAFHSIVGADLDSADLLPQALVLAKYRVVVKRPRKAPFLNEQSPSYQLQGKSSRYDIYTKQKMPNKLPVNEQ